MFFERECKFQLFKIQIKKGRKKKPQKFTIVLITCLWLNFNFSLLSKKIRQTFPLDHMLFLGPGSVVLKVAFRQPESGRIKNEWNSSVATG